MQAQSRKQVKSHGNASQTIGVSLCSNALQQVLPGPHQVPEARVLQRIADQAAGNDVRRLWPQPWGLQCSGGNLLALRRGLRGKHGQPLALEQQIGVHPHNEDAGRERLTSA